MSTTIRVYPQPGSVGAQRNQINKKNQQIVELRQQVQRLRNQLSAFTAAASPFGGYQGGLGAPQPYPTSYGNQYPPQTSAFAGFGQLFSGLFGGNRAPQQVGYGSTPWMQSSYQGVPPAPAYGYTPGYDQGIGRGW